jgi:Gram-negative bacterial TonB protein C-terminal
MRTVQILPKPAHFQLMVILTTITSDSFVQAAFNYSNSKTVLFNKQVIQFDEALRKLHQNMTAPAFINGNCSFPEYLQQRIQFSYLQQFHISLADLTVRFTISRFGLITNVRASGATGQIREEAEQVILQSAHLWKPAMQNGTPVDYDVTQKINFRIEACAAA